MQFFGKSDTGMKRSENQDSFVTEQLYENTVLCVVCDGMGGARGGKTASSLACREFLKHVKKKIADTKQQQQLRFDGKSEETEKLLNKAVTLTNSAIFKKATKEKDLEGMGTTLVSALFCENRLYVTNIGDSRLYFIKEDGMIRFTKDHSYVQTLIDLGQITPEEALTNPHKNIITKALGTQKKVEPDIFYKDLTEEKIQYVLLCSDGLTNFVDEDLIQEIIKQSDSLESACSSLIDKANENGGGDNITAVLIKLDPEKTENDSDGTAE